jgi:hypothetical protein
VSLFEFSLLCSKLSISRTFLFIHSQSGRNSKKYSPFDVHQPLGLLHSENEVSSISTEKALYQNVEKHLFSAHSTRLLTPEAKIQKNSSHSLKFRQFSRFSPNLKLSDISSRIRISLKKAEGLVFNRG